MRLSDHDAALTAHRIGLARRAGADLDRLDRRRVITVVARHSPVVRQWRWCEVATVIALPLGSLVFALGGMGILNGRDRTWSVAGVLTGGAVLAVLSVAHWFALRHSLAIAAGMANAEAPPATDP